MADPLDDGSDDGGGDRPTIALIAGPTASGKSAMALALAERADGVIVNADASQVYRDLRIVTARPSPADEARAEHRLYGHIDAAEACSAAAWAADARKVIAGIVADDRLPILVGGTGLYFRVLIDGIAPVPPIDPDIRETVRRMGAAASHAALRQEDPAAAGMLHPNDTTRLHRALEVVRSTGQGISGWRQRRSGGIGGLYRFAVRRIMPPAAETMLRCDNRVDAILADGGIEEVARLAARALPDRLPAMRAIGVPQIIALIEGRISREQARDDMRRATRQYAKRQRTWFRHQSMMGQNDEAD